MGYNRTGDPALRVLVVEDEALLSRQLATALGDAGYAVDCAVDGETVSSAELMFAILDETEFA